MPARFSVVPRNQVRASWRLLCLHYQAGVRGTLRADSDGSARDPWIVQGREMCVGAARTSYYKERFE